MVLTMFGDLLSVVFKVQQSFQWLSMSGNVDYIVLRDIESIQLNEPDYTVRPMIEQAS